MMKLTIHLILISIVSIVSSVISGCTDKDEILFSEIEMLSSECRGIEIIEVLINLDV